MRRALPLLELASVALLCGSPAAAQRADPPAVVLTRAPREGFRPQAAVDAAGGLHVVQATRGRRTDLVYLRRAPGAEGFSEPVPVNTTPAIVAGFDLALGAGARVHVLMRPNPRYSKLARPDDEKVGFFDLAYMLYARLDDAGERFEPERDLSGATIGFEGAGTILADGAGRVAAYWHGQLVPEFDEPSRQVFRALSTDGGRTFSAPEPVESGVEGACQCCSMAGALAPDGRVVLTLRNSTLDDDGRPTKDSWALVSSEPLAEGRGLRFAGTLLEPWGQAGCPGSSGAVACGPGGTLVAWRTRASVRVARLGVAPGPDGLPPARSPAGEVDARVPRVVQNDRGQALCLWCAAGGPGSKGAGDLAWQVYGADGAPLGPRGRLRHGVAAGWGAPCAVARADGSFEVLYDGDGE